MIPDDLLRESAGVLDFVKSNIAGRSADVSEGGINTRVFACLSVTRGDGDVLEIGSFFGVSAITAAALRKVHGIQGSVVCLDPMDGRVQVQSEQTTGRKDEGSGLHWTAETLLENARRNAVELELVQKPSQPFPAELRGRRFTLVYVDGDHWHNTPRDDFESVMNLTRCVIFDDHDEGHPHVMNAVEAALHAGWKMTIQKRTLAVLERLD